MTKTLAKKHKNEVRNYIRRLNEDLQNQKVATSSLIKVRPYCRIELVKWDAKRDEFLVKAWDNRDENSARYECVYGYGLTWRWDLWSMFNDVVFKAQFKKRD